MNWEEAQLIDKTSYIKRGISPKYVEESGFIIINQKCIRDNRIDYSPAKFTDNQKTYPQEKILQKGDILINSTGRGTLGRTAQIKDELEDTQFVDTHITILRAKEDIDPFFLGQLIRRNEHLIESLGKGSTQQLELSRTDLGEIKLSFPPLTTQQKIASILSAYDDLIENNLKRIKLLEEKAQLYYLQYKPVEKFALQNLAEYLGRGVTPKYEDASGFYAINQKSNKGTMLDYNQFKSLDTKLEVPEEKFAKWGDLLVNSLGEGTLGRVHFYTDKSDVYAVDQHMSIFRTSKLHYTFYLYQFLSSDYGQGLIETLKKGGTNMTMLNISDLRQLEVSFPKEKELEELWAIAVPIYKLKQVLTNQNTKLREARDILLPRLMSGEIEV